MFISFNIANGVVVSRTSPVGMSVGSVAVETCYSVAEGSAVPRKALRSGYKMPLLTGKRAWRVFVAVLVSNSGGFLRRVL